MKVAVASNDGRTISAHFGRSRGFVIFEVNDGEVRQAGYLENTFTGHALGHHHEHAHHSGGGYHQHHHSHRGILEALQDVDVVISHGMGWRIYEDLKSAGKQVFVTEETDVEKAVKMYAEGKLTNLDDLIH